MSDRTIPHDGYVLDLRDGMRYTRKFITPLCGGVVRTFSTKTPRRVKTADFTLGREMKKSGLMGAALLAAFYGVSFPQSIQAAEAKRDGAASVTARRLFNGKDLSGWYTFLKERGKNVDPKGVFSVANGVIRITGEEWGGLVTEEYPLLW